MRAEHTEITYTSEKVFTQQQIQDLFLSVRWVSGQYPEQLYKALLNSQTVLTAWDRDKLVGLVRVIDDGALLAYIHYHTFLNSLQKKFHVKDELWKILFQR